MVFGRWKALSISNYFASVLLRLTCLSDFIVMPLLCTERFKPNNGFLWHLIVTMLLLSDQP